MIKLQNISLRFDERLILEDVSLNVEKNSVHVILGPSGAGKSTILKVILGLLQTDQGNVIIDGKDITTLNEQQILAIRRKIGFVFQGNALFDSLTTAENTAYFLSYFTDKSEEQIKRKVKEILSFVNLNGSENMYPDELSGGMKKRLAIARALATDPKIILFDEPTTGLDPINSKAILDLIKKLKRAGTTSVIVTHILNDAIMIGDVLSVISEGKVVLSGSVKEILQSNNQFIKDFFYEIYYDESTSNKIKAELYERA
ncbi:MAG: ATP-binding cassette domain-containing protein [Ignavibacterium sp.]|jgi:phospholipid/cholesterol/gamma-HCH transport system ATP-binding protein|nr:MAG: ATP-binding cassette domain-containing protein [Ignavibacterium sp.]MDD5607714.1 ATP-binding cassette domain-containing protein [Ignavibacterium sp.]MDX9711363.1 ATP-binding cassette domain-containing protein [Ignavibacteriaceae bacterium]MEB2355227.1 ATP-binding cassette domain-containing protein [Ignavibacteriales bacterium]GIK20608.1 MAG: ABC transporter ATP-binding protein [Ignavibacteriota bacterium]